MFDFLKAIPPSVAIPVACLILGVGGVFAADNRYVLKDAFQRNYELSLMEAIRDARRELSEAETNEAKKLLIADLEELLDEFCRGDNKDHRYCAGKPGE